MKYLIFAFLLIGLFSCKSSTKKNQNDTSRHQVSHKKQSDGEESNIDDEKQADSLRKEGATKAIFPGYVVLLHNFKVYNGFDNHGKLIYDVDSSEVVLNHKNNLVTLICKKDTLHLTTGDGSGEISRLQIIPNNEQDRFKVDFAYQVSVYQNDDAFFNAGFNADIKKFARWEGITTFTPITDSLNRFFEVAPGSAGDDFIRNGIRNQIAIRDTLITYHREYEEDAILVYKGKPCSVKEESEYYRIQRFNNGKLLDTKFIRVFYAPGE